MRIAPEVELRERRTHGYRAACRHAVRARPAPPMESRAHRDPPDESPRLANQTRTDLGRHAGTDPLGKSFIRRGEAAVPGGTPMSDEVGHFEIPADKPERARKFYADTFGWTMNVLPDLDYTMVSTGPVDEKGMPKAPGFIGGGIAKRGDMLEHPVVTIMVEEIDEAVTRIKKHGGTILRGKTPVAGGSMGWMAYFKDSEGNTVGLYQWPPP